MYFNPLVPPLTGQCYLQRTWT